MKTLQEYKANQQVLVKIYNPRTNNWEWVPGIVRGIIFNHTNTFFGVTVEFSRIVCVETTCSYKMVNNVPFFKYYESTYDDGVVIEGFDDANFIKPIGE